MRDHAMVRLLLAPLVEAQLGGDLAIEVTAHVAECAECQTELARLLQDSAAAERGESRRAATAAPVATTAVDERAAADERAAVPFDAAPAGGDAPQRARVPTVATGRAPGLAAQEVGGPPPSAAASSPATAPPPRDAETGDRSRGATTTFILGEAASVGASVAAAPGGTPAATSTGDDRRRRQPLRTSPEPVARLDAGALARSPAPAPRADDGNDRSPPEPAVDLGVDPWDDSVWAELADALAVAPAKEVTAATTAAPSWDEALLWTPTEWIGPDETAEPPSPDRPWGGRADEVPRETAAAEPVVVEAPGATASARAPADVAAAPAVAAASVHLTGGPAVAVIGTPTAGTAVALDRPAGPDATSERVAGRRERRLARRRQRRLRVILNEDLFVTLARPVLRRIVTGAVAAVLLAGGASALAVELRQPERGAEISFESTPPGVTLRAWLRSRPWGTELVLDAHGLDEGARYQVLMEGEGTGTVAAGTFLGEPGGATGMRFPAAVTRADVILVVVEADDGSFTARATVAD